MFDGLCSHPQHTIVHQHNISLLSLLQFISQHLLGRTYQSSPLLKKHHNHNPEHSASAEKAMDVAETQ